MVDVYYPRAVTIRLVVDNLNSRTPAVFYEVFPAEAHRLARKRTGTRWIDSGLVFTTGIGTALSPRNIGRSFDAMMASAGVRRVRLHDLRHVSA